MWGRLSLCFSCIDLSNVTSSVSFNWSHWCDDINLGVQSNISYWSLWCKFIDQSNYVTRLISFVWWHQSWLFSCHQFYQSISLMWYRQTWCSKLNFVIDLYSVTSTIIVFVNRRPEQTSLPRSSGWSCKARRRPDRGSFRGSDSGWRNSRCLRDA
jgi:hypothetical protein